jgi:cell division protein FtsX
LTWPLDAYQMFHVRFGRSLVVVCAVVTASLQLAACGSASKSGQPTGVVTVYFCTTASMPDCKANATPAEESAVGLVLRHGTHVVKLVYISKSTALKQFKKSNPGFRFGQLPVNPLPDKWVVTVDSEEDAAKVGEAICAAHYPGVEPCGRGHGGVGGVQWRNPLLARLP